MRLGAFLDDRQLDGKEIFSSAKNEGDRKWQLDGLFGGEVGSSHTAVTCIDYKAYVATQPDRSLHYQCLTRVCTCTIYGIILSDVVRTG